MDQTVSYVVPRYGTSFEPVAKALLFAESLTHGSPRRRDLVFLCHEKSCVASSAVGESLPELLGRNAARKFLAGDRVDLSASATLRLESPRTLRRSPAPEIALALDADISLLNSLSCFDRVEVVIAIAYTLLRIQEWTCREMATIPGEPVSTIGALKGNHIAIEALWALTYMVDHSNAWVNSEQRDSAVEILWSIYTRGCRPRTNEIERWARLNGWSPKSAEQLRLLASEVARNRIYPEELGLYWWLDTFEMLRSLAWLRRERLMDAGST